MLNELFLMMSMTAPLSVEPMMLHMRIDDSVMCEEHVPNGAGTVVPDVTYRWWHKVSYWFGRNEVFISGRVVMPERERHQVMVLVELPDGSVRGIWSGHNGCFTVPIPLESEVRLRFRKIGYVDKVVSVDTRHAQDGRRSQNVGRGVRFDVEMVREDRLAGFTYEGPVGTVSFIRGSGLMKVAYHEKLIQLSSTR